MSDLKFEHLNIPATDPLGLAQWYAKTFELKAEKHIVRGPGILLVFESGEPINRAPEMHIGFRVPSMKALRNWAKIFNAGLTVGAEFTAFRTPDPEGNCLELYTPNV